MIITDLKQLEQFKNIPAIYKFRFITNFDMQYIGEGGDLWHRIIVQYPIEIKRKRNHRLVIEAIREFGWNNIEIELIDWGEHLRDKWTRLAKETACIIEYNTLAKNGHGYNVRLFGRSTFGIKFTPEQCKNNARKKEQNGMWGKTHSEEAKIKIRANRALQSGLKNPKADKNIYTFKNKLTNEVFVGTRYDFIRKYNLNKASVCFLIHKKQKSTKKWILIENTN